MAKPMKCLELYYPMIQVLINIDIYIYIYLYINIAFLGGFSPACVNNFCNRFHSHLFFEEISVLMY